MIKGAHILLVEDEPSIARVVKESLERQGYAVTLSDDGRRALNLSRHHAYHLCIVDVMLPSMDGFTLVREIRRSNPALPVLYLTAKTATADLVEGYASGGNDYLKKPFSLEELFVRVAELLRRNALAAPAPTEEIRIGKFLFVPHRQSLQADGETEIRLSHKECLLLRLLYDHRNELLERSQALLKVWGDDTFFNGRTMDVFITKLRKHLKADPRLEILNVRGLGYKLICDP